MYYGVATPYKGIHVYTRSMGMSDSLTCLEKLNSWVLGKLIQKGGVFKISHDLYIGSNTSEVLSHWHWVVTLLKKNNLCVNRSLQNHHFHAVVLTRPLWEAD